MGDLDGEIYRSVNDIYGEVSKLGYSIRALDETMKQMLEEIKGLRRDMQQQKNAP
jgi:hypothetical protein